MRSFQGLLEAAEFAARKHAAQTRRYSGEPYICHCLRVAAKLAGMAPRFAVTEDMLTAALLHDTVEDTNCTPAEIAEKFGDTVARYVDALSLEPKGRATRRERYARYAQRIRNAPIDVQLIKICDMWDNIGDIRMHDPDFFPVYKKEALMIAAHMDKIGEETQTRLTQLLNGNMQAFDGWFDSGKK